MKVYVKTSQIPTKNWMEYYSVDMDLAVVDRKGVRH